MNEGLSVIICCYNSAALLPQTLLHIAKQKVSADLMWEVIVVDNASTDNTDIVAQTEWEKYNVNVPFKVVHELEPGLLKARIKGFTVSQYEYLLFCDDDNWLNEKYITNAYRIISTNKEIGICGGLGIPEFEIGSKPNWFKGHMIGSFALGPQAEVEEGPVSKDRYYIYGAGMVVRKAALAVVYNVQVSDQLMLSGRKGNALLAGDDAEISFFMIFKGYRLWYSSALTFKHFIQKKRLNTKYLINFYKGFGKTIPYLNLYHSNFLFIRGWQKFRLSNWTYQFLLQLNIGFRNIIFSWMHTDRKYISIMHFEAARQLLRMKRSFRSVDYKIKNLIKLVE